MYIVLGASGKTGGAVADTLLSRGKQVRVVVRKADQGRPWRERGAEVAVASLDDARALEHAFAGGSGLYALLPEDPGVPDFHAHRRRMVAALAAAVKASGVPHVVFLSAAAASVPDGNGPAADLHHAEQALRATGCRVTAVRASYFQENVLAVLAPARHEGIYPSFLPPDAPLPTIAARDVGRFAADCLLEPPARSEVVDLVGPMYTTRDLAARLGAALGKELAVIEIPAAARADVLVKAGLPRPHAESLAEMFACFASGRIRPTGDRMVAGATRLDEVLQNVA